MNKLTKTAIELGLAGIAAGCAVDTKDYFLVGKGHEDYKAVCRTLGIEESQEPKFKIKEDKDGKGYDITVITHADKQDIELKGTMLAEDPRIAIAVRQERALYKGFMNQLDDDGNITPNEAVHAARKYLQLKDSERKTHPFWAGAGKWARQELQKLQDNYKNVLETALSNETEMGIQLQVRLETREGEIPKKTPWIPANVLLADLKAKNPRVYESVIEQYGSESGVLVRGEKESTATLTQLLEMTDFFGTESNKLESLEGLNVFKCAVRAQYASESGQVPITDAVRKALGYEVKEKKPE